VGQTAFPFESVLDVTPLTLLGNNTNSVSAAKALTPSQGRALLDVYSTGQTDTLLTTKAAVSHTHLQSEVTGLVAALAAKADLVGGLVPSNQLPSYVDDVLEFANLAAFPATGETGKIYVALDTSRTYRWGGSSYAELTDSTAVWGSISGVLANQTDLASALASKSDTGHTHTYASLTGIPSTFTPSAHAHTASDISSGTLDVARIPIGTTASTVCVGNDSRLSDARTPVAHKSSHVTGQPDALSPSDIGAVPTTRTLTINGTALDLSADRAWTVSGGISSLNGLTDATQTFATGTTGTNFGIVSSAGVHTFNLPDASATARGVVTTGTQTFAGAKTFGGQIKFTSSGSVYTPNLQNPASGSGAGIMFSSIGTAFISNNSYAWYIELGAGNLFGTSAAVISWNGDLNIQRDAADTLAQRRGLNTQIHRVYNTFTDGSNLERIALQFTTYASARYAQLACESVGTGIANMNLVLTPKGTGALISGPMPDGTATGGNARGQYAIDLQTYRTAATQVAADYGVSIGTQITNIGGLGSVAIGRNCTISSGQLGGEVAIGRNCTVASYRGVAIGASAYAGSDGIAIGIASNAADAGSICFNGASSSWTGINIWRNNYNGNPIGTSYNQRTLTAALAVGLGHIRTANITQTTIETIGYTTFISNRFRHKGAIFHTSLSVFAVRSDGAIAKFQRNVIVKDISNAAGTSSTLSVIQVETVGTDYSEISGASISFAVDSTAKSVAVRCVGEAEYAATGVASTDIITAVGHPFANDDIVTFNTLTGGSGLTANPTGQYYLGIYKVINVSGNTFQLATPGSSTTPIDFTTDITAATIARPICWSTSGPMTTVLAGGY